jgi:hypothetical protein
MPRPDIILFCELGPMALAELFAQPDVIDELAAHQYSVALGIIDFSPQRAAVVRAMNERGIGVIAWLLLPPEEGYWFNLGNYPQAQARYEAFKDWVGQEQLRFDAVGLDIEPLLNDRSAAQRGDTLHMFNRAAQAQRNALYPAARAAYQDLAAVIRHDGYEVHTYQYPLIIDDRRAGTTVIQRSLDIVDVPADHEVLLLYSSHVKLLLGTDLRGAFVQAYGQHADGIAVGVTGGGFLDPISGTVSPRVSLKVFLRDLRIAAQYTDTVHIFSLEGCVERGWLAKLADVDWDRPPIVRRHYRVAAGALRALLGFVLWCSRAGWTALGWLGWAVAGGLLLERRVTRWRRRA